MEDLPIDILYKIGKHIDSRKLLLNLNLKNIFLPHIRDNYIYDYDTVRNNLNYFTGKYPKIYSGVHELTDKTIELLENCETVYNFYVVSNKVSIKNTKIKNMYRSKGNCGDIIDYPNSLEVLFTQEYTENIPKSIKKLYISISLFDTLDINRFNIYKSLVHLSITGANMFRNLDCYNSPPSLTSINLGSYSGSVKKLLNNNIKYLSTGVIHADDLEYLSKNIIYLKGSYFKGDLPEFPYFPCLEHLQINNLYDKYCKLHFNKLSEKLKTFICHSKFSISGQFPKNLEHLSCILDKDLSYLTNLRSLTLKGYSNDFIPDNKLFPKTISESLNILHSLESFYLTVPDGVKYLYLLDYAINIKYPNSLERIDIHDSIHRDVYMTFPVSVKTFRFNRTHKEYEPILDSYEYYDIPPTVDTIEFVANMDTTNHYKKFPNTVKKIIYNVLKKSTCEYFYLEIKDKIIIQYAYIPKLL